MVKKWDTCAELWSLLKKSVLYIPAQLDIFIIPLHCEKNEARNEMGTKKVKTKTKNYTGP